MAQGKFAVGSGKHRENKMKFEWVPWIEVIVKKEGNGVCGSCLKF